MSIEEIEKEAEKIIKEAEAEAERIIKEAKVKANRLRSQKIKEPLTSEEVNRIRKEYADRISYAERNFKEKVKRIDQAFNERKDELVFIISRAACIHKGACFKR